MRATLLAAALLLLASGCFGAPKAPPSPTETVTEPGGPCAPYAEMPDEGDDELGFAIWWLVVEIVCDLDGATPEVRDRSPGTAGRDEVAQDLRDRLEAAGWDASLEEFTGEDYDALEKGSVEAWASSCSDDDREHMLGLDFANVVADHGEGEQLTILMAHYDAKRHASSDPSPENHATVVPAANDGASGVAVWVELAAELAAAGHDGRYRILLVDGEDGFEDCHPLAGSIWHATNLSPEDEESLAAVYLLDMVGDPQARFCLAGNDAALRAGVRAAARDEGVDAVAAANDCSVLDDHTAFQDLGHRAVDLIDFARPTSSGFPPYWHTVEDTPDKLTPAMLGDVARVMLRLLA